MSIGVESDQAPRSASKKGPPFRVAARALMPVKRVVEDRRSLLSAVQQKNADDRMALEFVEYLYRCALECSFA